MPESGFRPTITVRDFLTDEEIAKAATLWYVAPRTFAQRVADEIIAPNIERINKQLRQENDVMFLAYVVEYVIGMTIQ